MAGGGTPPAPPNPVKVAEAQTRTNKETAEFQAGINRADQYTPQGNVTWERAGTWPDGSPKYVSRQVYSEGEQGIYDAGTAARQNYANTLVDQTGRINQALANPYRAGNEATEARLMELGRARLDPMFAEQQAALEQKLANQGIHRGSEAYDRAIRNQNYGQNDAYNQLLLSGRALANQENAAEYLMPLNAGAALATGSQVQSPSFISTPQTGVANTDIAGIYANNYNQQLQAYNAEQAQNNAMMGGLFGLGSAAIRAMPWSDRRVKRDIVSLGIDFPLGLTVYEWTLKATGVRQRGYMTDEVRQIYPHAVYTGSDGFDRLDYGALPNG